MNELERISALLPTELYQDSKDWREGSVVERVEWLLSMYQSSHEDVLRLEQDVDDLKMGRYYPADEFDK
jgi:hypothetical protein